jgi:CRISPR-associated protein Cas5d
MNNGEIHFDRPEQCEVKKFVRQMSVKAFGIGQSLRAVDDEAAELEDQA